MVVAANIYLKTNYRVRTSGIQIHKLRRVQTGTGPLAIPIIMV